MVTTHKLPAHIYETLCPRCGTRVEFPLFQASFYNFATYEETHSEQIFRLDLDACHYLKRTVDDLLLKAQKIIEDCVSSPNWIELLQSANSAMKVSQDSVPKVSHLNRFNI